MTVQLSKEVEGALAAGRPVVALESTLICHGIPRPRNIRLALELEAEVRSQGATPATIALMDGRIHVGLDERQIERLGKANDVEKCSVNALAPVLASRQLGATTVASTIYLAQRCGIRFMATGGIGGVHRGGETSMDVSADLAELQRSKLVVVAAGAKIILDLPRTMEVLETLGITVVGYQTDRLPGFYVRETELGVTAIPDIANLATLVQAQSRLNWPSSILVCNPPPSDLAIASWLIEDWLNDALDECRAIGMTGKNETPYLLKRLAEMSEGRTVELNEALVRQNAALAAQLAVEVHHTSG